MLLREPAAIAAELAVGGVLTGFGVDAPAATRGLEAWLAESVASLQVPHPSSFVIVLCAAPNLARLQNEHPNPYRED